MLVGTQATMTEEQRLMLGQLPLEICRLGERIRNGEEVAAATAKGVKSVWACREYGSLRSGAEAGLRAGAWRIELGNEPYWEGVNIASFAREVADILERTPDRTRFTVACMEGTGYNVRALLAADSRLSRLLGGTDGAALTTHPYDAYGTGPGDNSNGSRRWKTTHDAFVSLTGRSVKINASEFGWCTPPYVPREAAPRSLPLAEERRQAEWIIAQLREMEAAGYVEFGCVYHFAGYYNNSTSRNLAVSYNGLVHREDQERYIPKPAHAALRSFLEAKRPAPAPVWTPRQGDSVHIPAVVEFEAVILRGFLVATVPGMATSWMVACSEAPLGRVIVVPTEDLRQG